MFINSYNIFYNFLKNISVTNKMYSVKVSSFYVCYYLNEDKVTIWYISNILFTF